MQWSKAVIAGFLIWLFIFGITTLLWWWDVLGKFGVRSVLALVYGFAAYTACGMVKPVKVKQALAYGLVWFVMSFGLDLLITLRFNSDIFTSEFQWLSYALMIIFTIFGIDKTSKNNTSVASMGVD